jgi:drug/metabolite transporter (DMT)-like permease
LIVGIFSLRQLYLQKRRENAGYQPVGPSEDGDEDVDHRGNVTPKAVVTYEDGRTPISGLRVFLLAIPACCDIAGTTLMNVGLLFVAASIYQMTRGALVLFVGLFSVLFLKRVLYPFQWFALFVVVIGVGVVGLAGAIFKDPAPEDRINSNQGKGMGDLSPAVSTVIGVLLIAFAQVFTATQFVVEEWVLEKYSLEPLKVVGWEGIFGFTVTILGMAILHFTIGATPEGKHGYFNAVEGWREMTQYPTVALSSIAIMVSIGGFNFFGISVTRSISATARSIIDTCRTLFIWMVSLALHWGEFPFTNYSVGKVIDEILESFKWLQIVGFGLLVYGTFLFNGSPSFLSPPFLASPLSPTTTDFRYIELVQPPLRICMGSRKATHAEDQDGSGTDDRAGLLPEGPIEHV